ncbi:hypothetical protein VD0002_g3324 [Verticillium dahliae]|nr:hypothetical protein VD0002_g3324 [Verticillium dahliae]
MTGADPVSVQALEADSDLSDADSAIQSLASSSESITSSILRSREENGRTYHAFREGKYVLPNDEGENERLDLQHHLYTLTFDGKLFTCPAGRDKPIVQALDAGTGTGIWAMDFADDHPETKPNPTGLVNLLPHIQTFLCADSYLCVPPNVTFYIDDIEDRWTFSTGFDFIYSRMLTASIKDWPSYIHQCYDNLEPGGWLEISDILLDLKSDDNTVSPASPAAQWGRYMLEAAAKFGRPLDSALFLKQQLADAGFTHIVETIYKWPSNSWPKDPKFKELGMWTYENLGNGASGLSMALFTRALGWTQQEVELFLVDVRRDMKDRSVHGYWPLYVVYGQKPGAND